MNWKHPEEVMRAKILSIRICCLTCLHRQERDLLNFCGKRALDPNPNSSWDNPKQVCEDWSGQASSRS